MNTSAPIASLTLADALWPSQSAGLMRPAVLAVAGSLLMVVCAKIQVPMWPVPMTMQTFGILIIGAAYGWPLGIITVLLYLAEGFAGLPVFAGATAGPAYFAGTTGGYLVGFAAAAGIVGWLAERGWTRGIATTAAAMVLGNALIYVFGLAWLDVLLVMIRGVAGWDLAKVLHNGMVIFLVGDAVKAALAAVVLPAAWTLARRPA